VVLSYYVDGGGLINQVVLVSLNCNAELGSLEESLNSVVVTL